MTVLAPPTVGVIGCGPGGMSFLHAIATRRRKLEEDGDEEGLSKLPIISVFERSSTAGGVWKSSKDDSPGALTSSSIFPQDVKITDEDGTKDVVTTKEDDTEISVTGTSISSASSNQNDDVHDDDASGVVVEDNDYIIGKKVDSSTSMYEALWTNGPNQVIEYPDYTFKEHFKQALPIYLPRGALLEYMMARVTKNNPNFFDDVRFNTTVNNVSYDEVQKKFVFMLMDNISGERRVEYFDKCIWAAGLNGCAKIPRSIRTTLHEGGFKGIDIHSSEAGDVLGNFKDKQIVLIGDAFSAEDIALQAVKLGVKKTFVLSRSGGGSCCSVSAWPGKKVRVLDSMFITEVINEGKGLKLVDMIYDAETQRTKIPDDEDEYYERDLTDISAVIYCTGYESNENMIDESMLEEFSAHENLDHSLPPDWKMKPNPLTEDIGEVTPQIIPNNVLEQEMDTGISLSYYRGISRANKNLFYLSEQSENPLLEIDVRAWYYAAVIMGDVKLPSDAEMVEEIRSNFDRDMHVHFRRCNLDTAYYAKIQNLEEEDEDHWILGYDIDDPRYFAMNEEYITLLLKVLGDEMKLASYPTQIGSMDGLNEKGQLLLKMSLLDCFERQRIRKTSWQTFRDIDPTGFKSLHTGTEAVPLKAHWLDIDDMDPHPHLSS